MIVKDLNEMDKIVASNQNLSWVGWNVVERHRSEKARTAVNGVHSDGQWYLQRVYTPDHEGWNIPNNYKG